MKKRVTYKGDKEYEMLRTEILQNLKEYQSIRNMMYVATVTILGFGIGKQLDAYIFLLPLIVVLPSYINTMDIWKNIDKIAMYLMVFHEKHKECSYHWETRLFRLTNGPMRNQYIRMNHPYLPYLVCTILCNALYFANIDHTTMNTNTIIGIATFFFSLFTLLIYGQSYQSKFVKEWKRLKHKEIKKKALKNTLL